MKNKCLLCLLCFSFRQKAIYFHDIGQTDQKIFFCTFDLIF